MAKKIKIKVDPKTKDSYLDLSDFADMIDISKVVYYELTPVINLADDKAEGVSLEFFDKDNKKLPVKG